MRGLTARPRRWTARALLSLALGLQGPAAWAVGGAEDPVPELIKTGQYDRAIEILKEEIAAAQDDPARLERAYLLLIKTYVIRANFYKFEPEGRGTAELYTQESSRTLHECLQIPALRHVRPVPASDYPPEMVELFEKTRGAIFGTFRVSQLAPADAEVLFDDLPLQRMPADSLLGDTDIPAGAHVVTVKRRGYRDLREEIMLPAGVQLERSYELRRARKVWTYVPLAGVVAASIVGVLVMRGGGDSSGGSLPPPPPPPGASLAR